MTTTLAIQGVCDPRFEIVKEAFAQNFADYGEVGAAVAVMVGGRLVVDLWAGHADAALSRSWQQDTIVNVFSTTKGMTAICAHRLADQGLLDIDAPVAKYWPEFAQAGKDEIPVRYLLSHRAGLSAIRKLLPPGSAYDWERMTSALAAEEPWWQPGSKHGYHALTFGYLVGEVVRRISGKSLGTYFSDEVAGPLGLDFHIGLSEQDDARVAEMLPMPLPEPGEDNLIAKAFSDPQSMTFKAFANPPDLMVPGTVNSRPWRVAEIPAANGHADARSLARIYGALAQGGELDGIDVLSLGAIDRARVEQSYGDDAVLLGLLSRFGMGFMLDLPEHRIVPQSDIFGHPGAGGSIGFADPEAGLGFGYVMNKMIVPPDYFTDPRWRGLVDATYAAL
ncbi:MAG: beta-lactamase family protein [Chloroflexi bacterium]|nr:MAG: beta-lactamase family protein [Chloroflexota bacterium]